jgi:hypothetical protein
MGNVVEEIKRNKALQAGMNDKVMQKYNDTKHFIESKGVYNILYRTLVHLLPADRHVDYELHMEGGSYTNNKKVVVGLGTQFDQELGEKFIAFMGDDSNSIHERTNKNRLSA